MKNVKRVVRLVCLSVLTASWLGTPITLGADSLEFESGCCKIVATANSCNSDPQTAWNSYSSFVCQDQCFLFQTWAAVHCQNFQTTSCGPVNCDDDCYESECDEDLPCCDEWASCWAGWCEGPPR